MWNNEQFGSILLKIGRLFLIWPSLQLKGSSNHKYVCLIYTVFSISLYLYSTKGRFETIYTVSNSTATVFSVLDQFSQSCSCFFNIIPCIYLAFVKVDSYIKFFRKIKELGNVLRNDWLQSRKQCWIFFIFQSIVFMGLIFNVYVLTNYYEVGIYSYFLMRDIEFFQWSLNACIMFFCTMWIRNLFVELNNRIVITTKEKLARNLTVEEINRKTFNDVYRTKNEQSYSNVSLHFEICKLVNLFNDVFGLNILFLIVNCIVLLLFNVAVCAMYGLKSGNPVYGSTHDVSLLFCRFQRIFVLLVSSHEKFHSKNSREFNDIILFRWYQ